MLKVQVHAIFEIFFMDVWSIALQRFLNPKFVQKFAEIFAQNYCSPVSFYKKKQLAVTHQSGTSGKVNQKKPEVKISCLCTFKHKGNLICTF